MINTFIHRLAEITNNRMDRYLDVLFFSEFPFFRMGKQQSKIAPEVMNDLRANTNFTDKEIVDWYDGFKKDCPTGRLDVTEFKETFKS